MAAARGSRVLVLKQQNTLGEAPTSQVCPQGTARTTKSWHFTASLRLRAYAIAVRDDNAAGCLHTLYRLHIIVPVRSVRLHCLLVELRAVVLLLHTLLLPLSFTIKVHINLPVRPESLTHALWCLSLLFWSLVSVGMLANLSCLGICALGYVNT